MLGLRRQFSNHVIERKIINKVRTNGYALHSKLDSDFSDGCDSFLINVSKNTPDNFMAEKRNRSIFLFKEDERTFLKVFPELFQRVVDRKG